MVDSNYCHNDGIQCLLLVYRNHPHEREGNNFEPSSKTLLPKMENASCSFELRQEYGAKKCSYIRNFRPLFVIRSDSLSAKSKQENVCQMKPRFRIQATCDIWMPIHKRGRRLSYVQQLRRAVRTQGQLTYCIYKSARISMENELWATFSCLTAQHSRGWQILVTVMTVHSWVTDGRKIGIFLLTSCGSENFIFSNEPTVWR